MCPPSMNGRYFPVVGKQVMWMMMTLGEHQILISPLDAEDPVAHAEEFTIVRAVSYGHVDALDLATV